MPFINDYIERDFDVDADGNTPLHRAMKRGNLMLIRALVEEYGENPRAENNHNVTPLQLARRYRYDAVVRYLEKQCAADEPMVVEEKSTSDMDSATYVLLLEEYVREGNGFDLVVKNLKENKVTFRDDEKEKLRAFLLDHTSFFKHTNKTDDFYFLLGL